MQLIELVQGSEQWHAHRSAYFNSSEAAAMMGVSPYMTRDELLRQKKTGITPEVSEHQQRIFDKGHQIEALSRPVAEDLIGKELFPCVAVLEGTKLSASFDGLTMDESIVWECKSTNQELRAILSDEGKSGADLPLHYRAQLEQQLLVSGAEKTLFTAANINESGGLIEHLNGWYTSDSALRQRIIDGWQQFEKDLAAYEVKEQQAPLIGHVQDGLPVLHIAASGQLTASNLDDFKEKALAALAQINTHLVTDQDFADAEASVKWCKQVESALSKAKDALLSGTGIALVLNEINAINERFKSTRLVQEKAIKSKKENLKQALIQAAKQKVLDHAKALNEGLPTEYAIGISASLTGDLTAAIKGLKSLSSIKNALDSAVLKHISEANAEFRRKQQQQQQETAERLLEESAASAEPVSSSVAELEQILNNPCASTVIALHELNRAIYPIYIERLTGVYGLSAAALKGDWQGIKQALTDHIEQSLEKACSAHPEAAAAF